MENIKQLKEKVIAANAAYRTGTAIMSDVEFDELVETCQQRMSVDEFNAFRDSLNEHNSTEDKIVHQFVCGSLDKLKYEEPDSIIKFLEKQTIKRLSVSAKIDGLSGIAKYVNGKLVSFASRGDGYKGSDFMNKAKLIRNLPQTIAIKDELYVRGELVICKDDFEDLCEKQDFSNPRNAVAGLMNKKEFDDDDIRKISYVAYTILGTDYAKEDQFKILAKNKFDVAWNEVIDVDKNRIVEQLFSFACVNRDYECDGLVISDAKYRNEDKYRPDAQKAFKTNQQKFTTRVIDVDFSRTSKDGFVPPVAILEPTEVGGVIVSRATLHNLDFIEKLGLKIGSKVSLMRSGDVIPKILEVIENDDKCVDVELPEECPCCGSKLVRDGINMRCMNTDCKAQTIHQLTYFIKKLGCKHASDKSLEKFGILSFDDMLKFVPNKKHKSETTFVDELAKNVFCKSKQTLLAATNFKGLSETLINKIVDFYGFENIESGKYVGLPEGVGAITLQKFKDDILENLKIVNKIINDSRYNYLEEVCDTSAIKKEIIGSVCFTGKLNTMSRNEASKMAEAAGYEVRGAVNKGLTYLVTNDAGSGSSKNRKAKELGTKVVSEEEFLNLLKDHDSSLDDL